MKKQKIPCDAPPYSSPKLDQIELLDTDPDSQGVYDLVLNGNETGGGSIRVTIKRLNNLCSNI